MFELYSLVLVAHVMAGVALVGHSLGSPLVRAALREADTLAELRRIAAFERRASRWNPLVALALLASGIYLGSAGWWYFGWFYVSVVGWTVNALLAGLVVKSALGAIAGVSGDGTIPPEVDALRRSTKLAIAAQVMLANDIAFLFVMFVKPSALQSLAVFAIANAVLLGFTFIPRRSPAPELSEARS